MEKVIVSSNCQTGGVAAALKSLFPGKIIKPISINNENELSKELQEASTWLSIGKFNLAQNTKAKVMRIPTITFNAFHPDICYANIKSTGQLTKIHYNSHIAVWAFNNQIEISDAAKLFRYSTYKALGYFDKWTSSVNQLRNHFIECGYSEREFDKFFLSIKRRGVFMHTINHPLPEVLSELGKMIAEKWNPDQVDLDRGIVIADSLSSSVWPVYPEIGDELGFKGNYHFRIEHNEIDGIKPYLEFAYKQYTDQKISPSELIPLFKIPNTDNILSAELKSI